MVLSDSLKRGSIGPSVKGQYYQYQRGDQWVTAKWPKPRGKPKSERQKLAQYAFSEVTKAMKRTSAQIQQFHRENAKGTPMLPRDALMAALYGNGPNLRFYNGKVIKPMSNKFLASTVLDAIGWSEGAVMYRGVNDWEVLQPPPANAVMVYDPALKQPVWLDGSSLGGDGGYWMPAYGTPSTTSQRLKGLMFRPIETRLLERAFLYVNNAAGNDYRVRLYEVTVGRQILAILADEPVPAIAGTGAQAGVVVLPDPVAIEAGKYYALCVSLVAGPGGAINPMGTSDTQRPTIPLWYNFTSVALPAASPAVGDVLNDGGVTRFSIGMKVA